MAIFVTLVSFRIWAMFILLTYFGVGKGGHRLKVLRFALQGGARADWGADAWRERGAPAGWARSSFCVTWLPDEGVSGAGYLQPRVSASQRRVTPCSFRFTCSQHNPRQGGCWLALTAPSRLLSESATRPLPSVLALVKAQLLAPWAPPS